jgi:type IX secretion system PorP/SprF family membrane protein
LKLNCPYALLLVLLALAGQAQHYQFSQFYAAPTYLNPAFTGANVCSRVALNYRNQWAAVPGTFTSYQLTVDHTLRRINSGIGLQLFSDRAGIGNLRTTQVNLLYAYEARFNKKYTGRGGLSIGGIQRSVDYGAFTFGDQIARNASSSLENFPGERLTYFDISLGLLVYSATSWFGFSAAHMNEPDQSLTGAVSALPAEIKFHGGYKFTIEEHESSNKKIATVNAVTFAFNFKRQLRFNQLDLGIYYNKNWFVIGAWYRGIPLFNPVPGYVNNDAFVFLVGIQYGKYKIGYSYDFTVSKLSNVNTRGTNELSMSYQLCSSKKSKRRKHVLISCPKF